MDPIWHKEALFAGQTGNGFKVGTALTLGWFWVRVWGCTVLFRGAGMEMIDFENILAVGEADADVIVVPGYVGHEAGEVYFYVVRRANRCGRIEETLQACVRVSIDGDGGLGAAGPNGIFRVQARGIRGGKVEIVWHYCATGQESEPVCFNVYFDGGTGQVDYDNPVAVMPYRGRKFYRYESDVLEEGKYLFAVRAADAAGMNDGSMRLVAIEVNRTAGEACDIVNVEAI